MKIEVKPYGDKFQCVSVKTRYGLYVSRSLYDRDKNMSSVVYGMIQVKKRLPTNKWLASNFIPIDARTLDKLVVKQDNEGFYLEKKL
jgi:hypothetical protein